MVYMERKVAARIQQRHGADARRPVRSAATAGRHHQAGDEGTPAPEGGGPDPLRARADHLGGNRIYGVRRRAVWRRDDVLWPARHAGSAAGRRRERRDPVGVCRHVDGCLRHRPRRLELEQQVFAPRRAALVGADDQLRAVVRHGAGGGARPCRHRCRIRGIVEAQSGRLAGFMSALVSCGFSPSGFSFS